MRVGLGMGSNLGRPPRPFAPGAGANARIARCRENRLASARRFTRPIRWTAHLARIEFLNTVLELEADDALAPMDLLTRIA